MTNTNWRSDFRTKFLEEQPMGMLFEMVKDEVTLGDILDFIQSTLDTALKDQKAKLLEAIEKIGKTDYQTGREEMRKEVDNNVGQLRQWLNELPEGWVVTSEAITNWLFPEDNKPCLKEVIINDKDKKPILSPAP